MPVGRLLRGMPEGLIQLLVGTGVLAVAGGVANNLAGLLSFTITIGQNTYTVDLGIIPPILLAFGGMIMFVSGLRKTLRIRI